MLSRTHRGRDINSVTTLNSGDPGIGMDSDHDESMNLLTVTSETSDLSSTELMETEATPATTVTEIFLLKGATPCPSDSRKLCDKSSTSYDISHS